MSCYEWERGEFKLSCAEYRRVKKQMIAAYKEYWDNYYINALKVYEKMIAAAKGKRNVNWQQIYQGCSFVNCAHYSFGHRVEYTEELDPEGKVYNSYSMGNKRPPKPKKKDFKPNIDRKKFCIHFEETSISFNDQNKTIIWHVDENNHACERAKQHELGKVFFKILSTVKWTRGTGGQIVGNDEYNGDSYEAGSGGNYVKATYGPKAQKGKMTANYR